MNMFLSVLLASLALSRSTSFHDLSHEELVNRSIALLSRFASTASASELYDLSFAESGNVKCSPTIIRITERKSLAEDYQRPQVIVSGAIHGDERVGPQATVFAAELMVWSAQCHIAKSKEHCALLAAYRVTDSESVWLAFLASRRDTYVIPAANCLGYINNEREDAGVDPNRDFPYSREDNECLRSSTGRLFNAIMRANLIQVVVTFHGGMVAIGYEWGSTNHLSPDDGSPDDAANKEIGAQLSEFAGPFKSNVHYHVGRINSIVYPVFGGMEDWMYAGGWDTAQLKACGSTPVEPEDKSKKGGNRAIVFLVETSNLKKPTDTSLGGPLNPLIVNPVGSGHISQNARLAIRAVDVAMPYVCFMKTGVLTGIAAGKAIPETRFDFKWHVGGAITVDATWLVVHSPPTSFPSADDASIEMSNWSLYLDQIGKPHDPRSLSSTQSDTDQQSSVEANGGGDVEGEKEAEQGSSATAAATLPSTLSGVMSGYGRHVGEHLSPRYFEASFKVSLAQSSDSSTKKAPSSNTHVHAYSTSSSTSGRNSSASALSDEKKSMKTHPPATPQKSRTIHLAPGVYWVVAWSEVDSTWGKEKQGHGADTPQSYLSNARTNPDWLSTQSVHKNAPSNLRTSAVKSEVRKEYDSVKSREVRGRRLWPSDPVIIEVMADGQVLLQSTVLDCAWWRRGLSESEAYRSSIHTPKSSSSSKQTGAGAVAADGSHKEDSGSDNGGSKSSDESSGTPAEPAEPNSASKDKDTAAETRGAENDDNLNTTYDFTAGSFSFESGRGYMLLFGFLFLCIAVYIVRRLMSTSAAQSRARRIPAQFQRIPIAQA